MQEQANKKQEEKQKRKTEQKGEQMKDRTEVRKKKIVLNWGSGSTRTDSE